MGCDESAFYMEEEPIREPKRRPERRHEVPPWMAEYKLPPNESCEMLRANKSSVFNLRDNMMLPAPGVPSEADTQNISKPMWNRFSRVYNQSNARKSSVQTAHVDLFDRSQNVSVEWMPEDGVHSNSQSFHPIYTALDLTIQSIQLGYE